METLEQLKAIWLLNKEAERMAVEARRDAEDKIKALIGLADDFTGTQNKEGVKVVGRIDYKIDADKLQDAATEAGLSEHLGRLFRWKPELNMAAWKQADENIVKALSVAITAKPGRPSFSITQGE